MISRMKWAAGRKLRANTGETLTEVLISVLVIALGMTMFLSAFLASGRMLRQGEEQMGAIMTAAISWRTTGQRNRRRADMFWSWRHLEPAA